MFEEISLSHAATGAHTTIDMTVNEDDTTPFQLEARILVESV
jgi:hypothetical protein